MRRLRLQFSLQVFLFLLFAVGVTVGAYLKTIDRQAIAVETLREKGARVLPLVNENGEVAAREVIIDRTWNGTISDFNLLRNVDVRYLYVVDQPLTKQHVRIISSVRALGGVDVSEAEIGDEPLELLKREFGGQIVDAETIRRRRERQLIFTQEEIDIICEEWKATEEPPEVPPEPFQTHGGVI